MQLIVCLRLQYLILTFADAARLREVVRNSSLLVGAMGAGSASVDVAVVVSSDASAVGRPKLKNTLKSKGRARGPTNLGGTGGNQVGEEKKATKIGKCNVSFAAPQRAIVRCPEECPLMRFDPNMLCHWRCITEERCKSYPGVIDLEIGYCLVCAVAGCKRCLPDEQYCSVCHEGFELVDGECVNKSKWKWMVLLAILGVLILIVVTYVVYLAWRPVVSEAALEWGLEFRSKMKARTDDGNHKMYPLNFSLADEVTSAGGIGATLHFAWQRLMLWWAIHCTIGFVTVTAYHGRLKPEYLLALSPLHDEAEGTCTDDLDALNRSEFEAMRIHFLWLTLIVYVVSTAGAIWWAWWQQKKFQEYEAATIDMQGYALLCKGFPKEMEGDRPGNHAESIEEEYRHFFQSAWGDSVIGVSIAWNIDGVEEQVKATVNTIVHGIEFKRRAQMGIQDDVQECKRQSTSRSRQQCCCEPFLDSVNALWWGDVPSCIASYGVGQEISTPRPSSSRTETLQLLAGIPTSGFCFVVFSTERAMKKNSTKSLPSFRGEYNITVEQVEGDAETVLWDGFGTSQAQRNWNMFMGVMETLLIIAVWTLLFWGPYTAYVYSWRETAGASQGDANVGMVVGLLITIGNQIVYAACGAVSEKVRYTCRDHRDAYYTALYTFAVLVNTVLDMWLVCVMAKGWQRDAANDPSALVRIPSLQNAIFTQLILYLWPCTVLLPFVAEPFVLNIGPYFLAKWLVRAREGCTKQEAEECLQPPPFDLNRYGDNTINIMMVCLFFFLTAVTLWWIFLILAISLMYIYGWDCYRFKRGTARTHFATQDIDLLNNYFMAIPCALLAGGSVFKAAGGQDLAASWGKNSFFTADLHTWAEVGLAFFGHLFLHWLVLAIVIPHLLSPVAREQSTPSTGENGPSEITYEITASRICCNWFNANPVHCIRSHALWEHCPPHVFYQPGREYLHKKNDRPEDEHALIIYEAQDFCEELTFLQDMRSASSQAFRHAAESAKGLAGKVRARVAGGPTNSNVSTQKADETPAEQ